MPDKSKIHWTDATWNPVTGCSHVSPGCEHCYAESLSLRMGWSKLPWKAQNASANVILHPERLEAPLRWKKPRRIFVNSMSDLFHELIPDDFIDKVFNVMESASWHEFQVLTKRPERMRDYLFRRWGDYQSKWIEPPENVWIGTSVEDQRRADERIPILKDTPAHVRFLSCEPLLGPIDLSLLLEPFWRSDDIQWVIAGGESGPDFRPMDLDWARDIRDVCEMMDIPFFYKQGSALRPGQHRDLDGQLWEQYPGDSSI